jgi:hypothetical protein
MFALKLLAVSYILSCVVGYFMVRAAIDNPQLRRWFFLGVLMLPVVTVVATVRAILQRQEGRVWPYDYKLAQIEDEIEKERAAAFGEKPVHPSFSDLWKAAWLQSMEKAVYRVRPTMPATTNHESARPVLSCGMR